MSLYAKCLEQGLAESMFPEEGRCPQAKSIIMPIPQIRKLRAGDLREFARLAGLWGGEAQVAAQAGRLPCPRVDGARSSPPGVPSVLACRCGCVCAHLCVCVSACVSTLCGKSIVP